jgi:hypothetical protein
MSVVYPNLVGPLSRGGKRNKGLTCIGRGRIRSGLGCATMHPDILLIPVGTDTRKKSPLPPGLMHPEGCCHMLFFLVFIVLLNHLCPSALTLV